MNRNYIFLLVLAFNSACVHFPSNQIAVEDSPLLLEECTERTPSSEGLRCEKIFRTPLPVEALRERRRNQNPQLQPESPVEKSVLSFEQLRIQYLQSIKIGLDEAINLLIPNAYSPRIDKIANFIITANPNFTKAQVSAAIESRKTTWGKFKNRFLSSKNIDELTAAEVIELAKGKDPKTAFFLYEAYLRLGLDQRESDKIKTIWAFLFDTPLTENINRDFSKISGGGRNRTQLLKEYETALGLSLGPQTIHLIGILLADKVESSKVPMILADLIVEDPQSPIFTTFVKKVLENGKLTPARLLQEARTAHLENTNPEIWKSLVAQSIRNPGKNVADTLVVIDQWWFDRFESSGDVNAALLALRETKNLRKQVVKEDPSRWLKPQMALLTKMSSKAGRRLAIDELLQYGSDGAVAYIGNDTQSPSRVNFLMDTDSLSDTAQQSLFSFLNRYHKIKLSEANLDPNLIKLKHRIEKLLPELHRREIADTSNLLRASELNEIDQIRDVILKNQDSVEGELQRALASVLQANAPPALFRNKPKPWHAYLKSLPAQIRSEHLWSILRNNSSNLNGLSGLIAQLEPIEGVRDTVIRFIARNEAFNGQLQHYSQAQIMEMFGGDRFGRFFPHLKGIKLEGAIRTKFIIAIRTDPSLSLSDGLNHRWLQDIADDANRREAVPEVFGFRPALQYDRLRTQIRDGFTDSMVYAPAPQQIRGLIVQGHYEKIGYSIMRALTDRGATHIEELAPQIKQDLEAQLQDGVLSQQPPLVQRLFVVNWSLNADGSLINSIRNRAIRIAQGRNDFWNLRVEIHNFPTHDTLRRVVAYRQNMANNSRWLNEVDTMIQELQRFLGVDGDGGGGNIESIFHDRLALYEKRVILNELTKNFESLSPTVQLERLVSIRDQFAEAKKKSADTERHHNFYLGDQALSEMATVIFSRWLESLESQTVKERFIGITRGMEHLVRDDILSQNQVTGYKKVMESIISEGRLSEVEKKELITLVLKGLVDQVYFRIQDEFGFYDNSLLRTVTRNGETPLKFVDNFMRSGMVFMLSKVIDAQAREIAIAKNITHIIRDRQIQGVVEVYNSGETVGVLRLNKDSMELTKDDIAVFEQMPGESAAVSGFITVGVGARLSHLQLLSKSLKIPNVQVARDFLPALQELDGKWVRFRADEKGQLIIEDASKENRIVEKKVRVRVPEANHVIRDPIKFSELKDNPSAQYAGPKGVTLAKLFQNPAMRAHVPDGVVLPFGFFREYAESTGLQPLLDFLGKVHLENKYLIGILTAQIALKIEKNPIPPELLNKVKSSIDELGERTGNKMGYFFRSDTNVEDLPNFNGAGLNESVPNVRNDDKSIDLAIRKVWVSPYTEKSIYWRGEALGRRNVTLAEPSVVIMPTVQAQSSGVHISKGGLNWQPGHGRTSANFGIGSVVEAGRPVEEYTFELGYPVRTSMSVSRMMPVADQNGGLVQKEITPGTPVLTVDQVTELNRLSLQVEQTLGSEPHGWDIEWAYDTSGQLIILQARPNM